MQEGASQVVTLHDEIPAYHAGSCFSSGHFAAYLCGWLAGQQLGNLCGIYNTFGIKAHFVLFFTIHVGGLQNEGSICVVTYNWNA